MERGGLSVQGPFVCGLATGRIHLHTPRKVPAWRWIGCSAALEARVRIHGLLFATMRSINCSHTLTSQTKKNYFARPRLGTDSLRRVLRQASFFFLFFFPQQIHSIRPNHRAGLQQASHPTILSCCLFVPFTQSPAFHRHFC